MLLQLILDRTADGRLLEIMRRTGVETPGEAIRDALLVYYWAIRDAPESLCLDMNITEKVYEP